MSLTCENVTKTYGKKTVLQSVSLELKEHKIYGLIGRNGAGKTTLLSILTAQNPATDGTVTVDGLPVWENRKALEKLCFSREINAAESGLASMKVKEYLRIAATYYDNWDKNLEKRLLDLFRLEVRQKMRKLSKGMLSMVTIIVALCSKAPYTLLDEPVSGLDVIAREQFYQLLLDEYTATGRTFVVSTHIIEEAANIIEDIIIIHKGKVLVEGNTQEFVESARCVSGKADDVDAAVRGLDIRRAEAAGRSKGVTVFLKPGQAVDESYNVSVQTVNLQQAFVALCGEEAEQ